MKEYVFLPFMQNYPFCRTKPVTPFLHSTTRQARYSPMIRCLCTRKAYAAARTPLPSVSSLAFTSCGCLAAEHLESATCPPVRGGVRCRKAGGRTHYEAMLALHCASTLFQTQHSLNLDFNRCCCSVFTQIPAPSLWAHRSCTSTSRAVAHKHARS